MILSLTLSVHFSERNALSVLQGTLVLIKLFSRVLQLSIAPYIGESTSFCFSPFSTPSRMASKIG